MTQQREGMESMTVRKELYIHIVPRMAEEGVITSVEPEDVRKIDAALAMVMLFDGSPRKTITIPHSPPGSPIIRPKLTETKRKHHHNKRSDVAALQMMLDNSTDCAICNVSPMILLLAR